MKTGSKSIEATLCKRRILFAGSVARMEDTRLPICVMFGELVGGAVSSGGQEKEWMGCLLDDFRVFGIDSDKWTIAAQDEGEWHRTAKQGAEVFYDEMDRGRESQGYTTACSSVFERDGKDQREGSTEQASSYWFARHY